MNLAGMPSNQGKLSIVKDSERRGSRTNLANIGIHVQDRRNSRYAMEKQVNSLQIHFAVSSDLYNFS